MSSDLFEYIDSLGEELIRWQREMTAIPALGPENQGAGEKEKTDWLVAEMKAMGFSDIREYPCPDDRVPDGFRPNVSARVPGKSQKTLWIIAHSDVVPPGDLTLWATDPYTLVVDGDVIIGRGVEDNQQAIVTGLLAAKALLDKNIAPEISLGLICVADEETGMARGLPHVLEAAPDLISPDDLIIVPDMGNAEGSMVEVAEKGLLWVRFELLGKQCHASTPDQGCNTLVAASALVLALDELHAVFDDKNPIYSPARSTFTPTRKDANVENVNTIPGRDVFYMDCRVLPQYSLDRVIDECRRIARGIAEKYTVSIHVDIGSRSDAAPPTPEDAPVVKGLLKSLQKTRGVNGILHGVGGQTVAGCLRRRGIPAVVWSTLVPNAHTPNEKSRISSTLADAKVVLDMLKCPE